MVGGRRVEARAEVDVVDLHPPDERPEGDEQDHQHEDDEPEHGEPVPLEAAPGLGPGRDASPRPRRRLHERLSGS